MNHWKKQFVLLWIGQAISLLTSSVLQMSIVWYLTERTGSAGVLSAGTIIAYLPQAILGTFIGVYIDRYSRKMIMILADLFIAGAGLVLVLFSHGDTISVGMIFFVLCIRSVGAAFHEPALNAAMPLIVPEKHLLQCVGFAQSFESAMRIASPALAGMLFSITSLQNIIILDATGALFAVLVLGFIHIPRTHKQHKQSSMLRELREGMEAIRQKKGMVAILTISALFTVIYAPIGSLYPLYTMGYFGVSVKQSGFVETIFAVGMLAGSLILGIYGGKFKRSRALSGSMFVYGILLTLEGLLPTTGFRIFALLTIGIGIVVSFYSGVELSVLQLKTDDEYRGRVLSFSASITMLTMPIGLALSGVFGDRIGLNRWFLLSGIASLLLAAVLNSLSSVRICCDSE